jgi:hypothetical protein
MELRSRIPNEPKGRTITLGNKSYPFKPNERGHNVCEVKDKAHAAHLLALDAGAAYERYDPENAVDQKIVTDAPRPADTGTEPLRAASQGLDDPLATGTEKVDEVPDSENSVDDAEQTARLNAAARSNEQEGELERLTALPRKKLRAEYEAAYGKAAPKNWGDGAVIKKLLQKKKG